MSYEDLHATINPHTNRRSRKIKQYSKHLYNYKGIKHSSLVTHWLLVPRNRGSNAGGREIFSCMVFELQSLVASYFWNKLGRKIIITGPFNETKLKLPCHYFLNVKLLWYSIWQAVYSYLNRLFIRVFRGNLVTTNYNLVQNVVQTCQFISTIKYNQPTQNIVYYHFGTLSIHYHLKKKQKTKNCLSWKNSKHDILRSDENGKL